MMGTKNKLNTKTLGNISPDLIVNIVWIILVGIPLFFLAHKVFIGAFPFWYDPARDVLLAAANLKKLSLIGPPSGIPGIFYGPYWIWILSLSIFINPNPRAALFIVGIIPYLIFFPLLLRKFAKIFGNIPAMIIWILFIFNFDTYAVTIWNPNPAPLLFLALIYMVATTDTILGDKKNLLRISIIGLITGSIITIHLSLGIGIAVATVLYFFFSDAFLLRTFAVTEYFLRIFKRYLFFVGGGIVVFLPFLSFELRHNFLQLKAVTHMVTNSFFYNSAVVGQTGILKDQIVPFFFREFFLVFHLDSLLIIKAGIIFFGLLLFTLAWNRKQKAEYTRLILYLFLCIGCILFTYLSSKNPIWQYHFIGIEIIMLVLLGYLMKKITILKILVGIFSLYILITGVVGYIKEYSLNVSAIPGTLGATEQNVRSIYSNASGTRNASYAAYSSAIYTFDYDYTFQWLSKSYPDTHISHDNQSFVVYLIIPPHTSRGIFDDFISSKTSQKTYRTETQWSSSDGTSIIKRIKK